MSKRKTSGGDYQVGYRRPPKAHQFQKGAPSANPAGRPKKARTPDIRSTDAFHQLVLKEAAAEITVIEAGKEIRISKLEALVRQWFNQGIKGDARARKDLLPALLAAVNAEKKKAAMTEIPDLHSMDPNCAAEAYLAFIRGDLLE